MFRSYLNQLTAFLSKESTHKKIFFIAFISFFIITVIIPKVNGFIGGHHGWVSAEQLAIIVKSNWETKFVGYRMLLNSNPNYFSKGSFIYNAVFNFILFPFQVSTKLLIARLVMDLVYFLNIFLLFKLLYKITNNWKASSMAVLLGFSGISIVYYRDLIVLDNFLTLSFIISGHAILFAKNGEFKKSWIYMLIAISLGYVLLNTIPFIVWGLIELYNRLRHKEKINKYISIIVVAGLLSGTFFCYNLYMESKIRNVGIENTDVLDSFKKRAAIETSNPGENSKPELLIENYLPEVAQRFFSKYLIPNDVEFNGFNPIYLFLIVIFIALILKKGSFQFIQNNKVDKELLLIILISSGYTFFSLRDYAYYHDFAHVTLSILATIIWLFIMMSLSRFFYLSLIFSITLFSISNAGSMHKKGKYLKSLSLDVNDVDNINKFLPSKNKSNVNIIVEGSYLYLHRESPYCAGFFFSGYNMVSNKNSAEFIISKTKTKNTLTPENKFHFLYKNTFNITLENFDQEVEKLKNATLLDSSIYDIYLKDDIITVYQKNCSIDNISRRFFLHTYAKHEADLVNPENTVFNGLDFTATKTDVFHGDFMFKRQLYYYDINKIHIGQADSKGAIIWEKWIEIKK